MEGGGRGWADRGASRPDELVSLEGLAGKERRAPGSALGEKWHQRGRDGQAGDGRAVETATHGFTVTWKRRALLNDGV